MYSFFCHSARLNVFRLETGVRFIIRHERVRHIIHQKKCVHMPHSLQSKVKITVFFSVVLFGSFRIDYIALDCACLTNK